MSFAVFMSTATRDDVEEKEEEDVDDDEAAVYENDGDDADDDADKEAGPPCRFIPNTLISSRNRRCHSFIVIQSRPPDTLTDSPDTGK